MAVSRTTLERAAAEIVGHHVYLLFAGELPPGHWLPGDVAICFRCHADADYRKIIGDRWSGRGGCVVLSLRALRCEAIALRQVWPRVPIHKLFRWVLLSTFAHELTHAARDCIAPRRDAPLPPPSDRWKRTVQALVDAGPERKTLGGSVPFLGHDAKFIRVAAHVGHRLGETLGVDFLQELYPPAGLSESWFYLASVGDEMKRLRDVPLSQLDDIQPPQVFQDLWRHDITRWFRTLDNPSSNQADEFTKALNLFTL